MFLLSSISEGFSIATIQAMAAGLPSIVTRSGGPLEIISHGENGWMVDAGSPAAIAEAILFLAADPELCRRLAKNGREHAAKNFDMGAMLAAYEDLYDRQ
jgi:glycosyltransferase involved in cell wall biosynthesis